MFHLNLWTDCSFSCISEIVICSSQYLHSMRLDIHTIDLAQWTEAAPGSEVREAIARTWHQAASSHGLLYLRGHGLGARYEAVSRAWLQFCACEAAHKERFSAPVYGACGYNRVGAEAVSLSEAGAEDAAPDPVESLENGYSAACGGRFPRAENGYRHGDTLRTEYTGYTLKTFHFI